MRTKRVLLGIAGFLAAGTVEAQPYGMGPGPMVGSGPAYGMAPGVVVGPGGHGPGPRMTDRFAEAYAGLELSTDQRRQIAEIQQATVRAQAQLLAATYPQAYGMPAAAPLDAAGARRTWEVAAATRKAMLDLQLDAQRRIDAVLTPEQREHLRRYWTSR